MCRRYLIAVGIREVPVAGVNIPTQTESAANKMPGTYTCHVLCSHTGHQNGKSVYYKVVNATGKTNQVDIDLKGAKKVSSEGIVVVIKN